MIVSDILCKAIQVSNYIKRRNVPGIVVVYVILMPFECCCWTIHYGASVGFVQYLDALGADFSN